ncbi:MAG: Rieske 2Fe-2S domain-containing protein [Blastocatellia bacterium]|nr:Rieske 2Fe-2S domain-containing protein [Blastocatellia bacterium]
MWQKICIALHNGELHACAAKCPHASGKMAEGHIDSLGNIVCPLHRYKFNLKMVEIQAAKVIF